MQHSSKQSFFKRMWGQLKGSPKVSEVAEPDEPIINPLQEEGVRNEAKAENLILLVTEKKCFDGSSHDPIIIAGLTYDSAASFSVEKNMLERWGRALEITRDMHGNFIVYGKEGFPVFDSYDSQNETRHYRLMLICATKQEAEEKMQFFKSEQLSIGMFKSLHIYGKREKLENQYSHLLPYVYYEDSIRVVAVESVVST